MEKNFSIFNHVLSPVALGPSSSNTCGPYRVGRLAREVIGGTPKEILLYLATATSYPRTFKGSRSDLAFLNGLLGYSMEDEGFTEAYSRAEQAQMKFSYDDHSWGGKGTKKGHKIVAVGADGKEWNIFADSIGGGAVLISEINGFLVRIEGEAYEYLLFLEKKNADRVKEEIAEAVFTHPSHCISIKKITQHDSDSSEILIQVTTAKEFSPEEEEKLIQLTSPGTVRRLTPVVPVVLQEDAEVPFRTAQELLTYIENTGKNLFEAGLTYESIVTGETEEVLYRKAGQILKVIKRSIEIGLSGEFDMNGIVEPKAKFLKEAFGKGRCIPMGILDKMLPVSVGVMEHSNASGLIVCIPTGGSSGILPACLYGAEQHFQLTEKQMIEALFASGAIGICMTQDNSFSGGQYGCQAEVGCASAMASAMLVYLLGGSAQQACGAASFALQCLLGLVCDPIAGLVQVPCIARNMACTSICVTAANAVMGGFDPVVPFGEMFEAMKTTGRIVCKCKGIGATTTETGARLKIEQEERDARLREKK